MLFLTYGAFLVPDLPIIERRNWLIHLHYIQKDFDRCIAIIDQQLAETGGMCEYAVYAKGKTSMVSIRITCLSMNQLNYDFVM